MQLDVEMSPPAFVGAQLELECTCSVPRVYLIESLNFFLVNFGPVPDRHMDRKRLLRAHRAKAQVALKL